jgi:hypothetical protein
LKLITGRGTQFREEFYNTGCTQKRVELAIATAWTAK